MDSRTKQRLEFSSDDPFVAFTLDDSVQWDTGMKPDGVIVAAIEEQTWVCFIEMKGRPNTDRAYRQLLGGAKHFAPLARRNGQRDHGDNHHDEWSNGRDVLGSMPSDDHRVVGVFITFRNIAQRMPPPPQKICGKGLYRTAVQVTKKKPNRAEIDLKDLFRKAGFLVGA